MNRSSITSRHFLHSALSHQFKSHWSRDQAGHQTEVVSQDIIQSPINCKCITNLGARRWTQSVILAEWRYQYNRLPSKNHPSVRNRLYPWASANSPMIFTKESTILSLIMSRKNWMIRIVEKVVRIVRGGKGETATNEPSGTSNKRQSNIRKSTRSAPASRRGKASQARSLWWSGTVAHRLIFKIRTTMNWQLTNGHSCTRIIRITARSRTSWWTGCTVSRLQMNKGSYRIRFRWLCRRPRTTKSRTIRPKAAKKNSNHSEEKEKSGRAITLKEAIGTVVSEWHKRRS